MNIRTKIFSPSGWAVLGDLHISPKIIGVLNWNCHFIAIVWWNLKKKIFGNMHHCFRWVDLNLRDTSRQWTRPRVLGSCDKFRLRFMQQKNNLVTKERTDKQTEWHSHFLSCLLQLKIYLTGPILMYAIQSLWLVYPLKQSSGKPSYLANFPKLLDR